jgi:hypothetical protein
MNLQVSTQAKSTSNLKVSTQTKSTCKEMSEKTATVDSDDEANGDEEEGDAEGEDQVDKYECLQEQRETDHLVSHNVPRTSKVDFVA